jgi:hypothetical protein
VSAKRKKAVSFRLASSDVRTIKTIATRLGARDSDVARFALKLLLSRIAPFADTDLRGRRLLPAFLEVGEEMIRHFELDVPRLKAIINDGAVGEQRVDENDIVLLAMSASGSSYAAMHLEDFAKHAGTLEGLRGYLYDKYVHRHALPARAEAGNVTQLTIGQPS